MRLRPTEHLENRKMHTQERQLTRFFCILQLIYKENRTDGSFQNRTETKPNPQFFSKSNRNRTELEKSIPHIPTVQIPAYASINLYCLVTEATGCEKLA